MQANKFATCDKGFEDRSSRTRGEAEMERLSQEELREMKLVFKIFDEDGTDSITVEKLRKVAKVIGQENVPDEILEAMILVGDLDCDGVVNFGDFYGLLAKKKLARKLQRIDYM